MFTQDSSGEKAWKASPSHPNSMQRQKMQEHDAGERARENLEAKSRSLGVHRIEYKL
jgi:hypothetical protein